MFLCILLFAWLAWYCLSFWFCLLALIFALFEGDTRLLFNALRRVDNSVDRSEKMAIVIHKIRHLNRISWLSKLLE